MDRHQAGNITVPDLTDEELAGVSGGMTVVEGVLRAAALMRGIAYPCLSINDPVTIREGYICNR
jgi:hypothetical protein